MITVRESAPALAGRDGTARPGAIGTGGAGYRAAQRDAAGDGAGGAARADDSGAGASDHGGGDGRGYGGTCGRGNAGHDAGRTDGLGGEAVAGIGGKVDARGDGSGSDGGDGVSGPAHEAHSSKSPRLRAAERPGGRCVASWQICLPERGTAPEVRHWHEHAARRRKCDDFEGKMPGDVRTRGTRAVRGGAHHAHHSHRKSPQGISGAQPNASSARTNPLALGLATVPRNRMLCCVTPGP